MIFFKKNGPLIFLLFLSLATRFIFLSYPAEVVFDEVHFGKFVSAYFTHEYYFDIHPPLGKLLIAVFSFLFGFQGNFDFANIGEIYNSDGLFVLRFLPAFFSALFVVLIYYLVLAFSLSKKAAFLAGFFVLFDNAILGQSKFILVDIFLLFFGFAGILFFFLAKRASSSKTQLALFVISALFTGLSFSVKWTGLSFLGIIMTILFFDFLNTFNYRRYLLRLSLFIAIPFLVYALIFAIHFNLLKNSGPGSAFMTPAFQKTLAGNNIENSIKPLSFTGKFLELNEAMYKYNASITASHPYSSRWHQWPLGQKPIWYWQKISEHTKANIYLVANPVVWWLVLFSVVAGIILIFFRKFRKKISPLIYLLLFGYFFNLLPFMFVSRVTFLYHYLASLIFGILIFALLVDKFFFKKEKQIIEKSYKIKQIENRPKAGSKNFLVFLLLLLVISSVFLILSPLTYGLPAPSAIQPLYKLFLK